MRVKRIAVLSSVLAVALAGGAFAVRASSPDHAARVIESRGFRRVRIVARRGPCWEARADDQRGHRAKVAACSDSLGGFGVSSRLLRPEE